MLTLNIFFEGGIIQMSSILLLLILIIFLFIKEMISTKEKKTKAISLMASLGLFAIVLGFLWQIIGIMPALTSVSKVGSISPTVLASGLKISFYAPIFGMLTFLIARLGIIILTVLKK